MKAEQALAGTLKHELRTVTGNCGNNTLTAVHTAVIFHAITSELLLPVARRQRGKHVCPLEHVTLYPPHMCARVEASSIHH
jgi:hypothetical protein